MVQQLTTEEGAVLMPQQFTTGTGRRLQVQVAAVGAAVQYQVARVGTFSLSWDELGGDLGWMVHLCYGAHDGLAYTSAYRALPDAPRVCGVDLGGAATFHPESPFEEQRFPGQWLACSRAAVGEHRGGGQAPQATTARTADIVATLVRDFTARPDAEHQELRHKVLANKAPARIGSARQRIQRLRKEIATKEAEITERQAELEEQLALLEPGPCPPCKGKGELGPPVPFMRRAHYLPHLRRRRRARRAHHSGGPRMTITINHSGDGTTVEGTAKGDAPHIKAVGGFRWSRNLGAWYLPRTWTEPVRARKARQLLSLLESEQVPAVLVLGELAKSTTADERAEAHVARAAELAERHADRAERREAESDAAYQRSQDLVAGIPVGQPILAGHHSERRHRNTLDKSWNALGKSVALGREAEEAEARAQSSAAEARSYDQPARVGRRIERNEAELRRWQRNLAASTSEAPTSVQWRERARVAIAELEDKIARDEQVLAASPAAAYGKDTVEAGDLVKVRGHWYAVDKANPKTFAVTGFGLDLKYPYTEIQEHKRPTPEQVRAMYEARHDSDLRDTLRNRRLPDAQRQVIESVLNARADALMAKATGGS